MGNPSVRLTSIEVDQLIQALIPFLANIQAKLYLYGSRTQLDKRGGDIDLLLVVTTEQQRKQLLYEKHIILVALEKVIGEQKIDLCFATKEMINQDPFLALIWPQTVLLHEYIN